MSDRFSAVLAAINDHWREHGIPPTSRAIIDRTDITSTSIVRYYLSKLEQAGLIVLAGGPGCARKAVPVPLLKTIQESYREPKKQISRSHRFLYARRWLAFVRRKSHA